MRHAAKGPPFHSGPLATYRNGPVSSNVRPRRCARLHSPLSALTSATCHPTRASAAHIAGTPVGRVARHWGIERSPGMAFSAASPWSDAERNFVEWLTDASSATRCTVAVSVALVTSAATFRAMAAVTRHQTVAFPVAIRNRNSAGFSVSVTATVATGRAERIARLTRRRTSTFRPRR